MIVTRCILIEQARTWIGTPYHHQGRLKGIGVDCIGFIIGACKEVGLPDFDNETFRAYGRRPPRGEGMLLHFDKICGQRKTWEEKLPGDIMVFWINGKTKRAQHIALYTGYGLLHTHTDVEKVCEHGLSDWWSRFICAYSIPGVR